MTSREEYAGYFGNENAMISGPEAIAPCCLLSDANVIGEARQNWLVEKLHSSLPIVASAAMNSFASLQRERSRRPGLKHRYIRCPDHLRAAPMLRFRTIGTPSIRRFSTALGPIGAMPGFGESWAAGSVPPSSALIRATIPILSQALKRSCRRHTRTNLIF